VRTCMIAAASVVAALWIGHASEAATPSATPAEEAAPAVSAAPAAAAGRSLLAVRAESTPQGTLVHLDADGELAGAKSFTLSQPARLVIDLPGVQNKLAENLVRVDGSPVQRIRVGQHEGKVRVVLDAGDQTNAFEGMKLEPVAGGLVVALGGADAAAARTATPGMEGATGGASSTAAAAPAPAPGATVQNVAYASGEDADRIVVSADRAVDYQVMRPDPQTLMLVVPGATLAPEAATRVAPEGKGPISLVSAFQQPDSARPEVRIVIERAAGLEPQVSRDGNDIVLAFERGS